MSFSPLSEYSEGSFPTCGMATPYTICEGVSGYTPIDVSGLQGVIDSAIDAAMTDSDNKQKQIERRVSDLSNEWGTKFISIDNNDLNIVNVDTFLEGVNVINTSFEEQRERCNEIVNTIVSKTENVKEYLKVLEENNKNYENVKRNLESYQQREIDLVNRYNAVASQEQPNYSELSVINKELGTVRSFIRLYSTELQKYESARIDSPDGSWVLG